MPELIEVATGRGWTLYRIDDKQEHYYLHHASGTVYGLFSDRERDHLAAFVEKIAGEVDELKEERQELDNRDQVDTAPFLRAIASSGSGLLGWEIRFYSAPDYDDEQAVPTRTMGLSDDRLRELAASGVLKR